ncbi:hypothetical protein D3C78_1083550 [compost metagenome]
MFQQMANRCAQARPDVTGLRNCFTGERHHAFGQRFTVDNRAFYRIRRPDVLHQHANIGGASAMRNLFSGQDLRELFRTARRVFGWNDAQANIVTACQHRTEHGNGLRFIIFNTDQHFAGLQNMRKNADAFYDLCRAILHQTVVGGNIRLTFCGIDD